MKSPMRNSNDYPEMICSHGKPKSEYSKYSCRDVNETHCKLFLIEIYFF